MHPSVDERGGLYPLADAQDGRADRGVGRLPVGVAPAERDEIVVLRHLDDVMLRRTGWHYAREDRAQVAEQAAAWMAAIQGWNQSQRQAELDRYRTLAVDVS